MQRALPFFILLVAGAAYLYFSQSKEGFAVPEVLPLSKEQTLPKTAPRLPTDSGTAANPVVKRMQALYNNLNIFLTKEGAQLQTATSQPDIILPLQRAYADKEKLRKDLEVIERNASAPITITEQTLYDMETNLNILRRTVARIEGFENAPQERATPAELDTFLAKVRGEIVRLSASATTDPIINARINALRSIEKEVEDILNSLQAGIITADEIPIFRADIENAFTRLSSAGDPLPTLIKQTALPTWLENAIPENDKHDPESRKLYANIVNNIVNGLSVTLGVKYTAPYEAMAGGSHAALNGPKTSEALTGFPSVAAIENVAGVGLPQYDIPDAIIRDEHADSPLDENREPASYDWRGRAMHICEQVRLRGLNPADFGCIAGLKDAPGGWRGYTRMICSRLGSTMDPGLPETCGCPPENWRGWGLPRW
jgi:hypothetical protein